MSGHESSKGGVDPISLPDFPQEIIERIMKNLDLASLSKLGRSSTKLAGFKAGYLLRSKNSKTRNAEVLQDVLSRCTELEMLISNVKRAKRELRLRFKKQISGPWNEFTKRTTHLDISDLVIVGFLKMTLIPKLSAFEKKTNSLCDQIISICDVHLINLVKFENGILSSINFQDREEQMLFGSIQTRRIVMQKSVASIRFELQYMATQLANWKVKLKKGKLAYFAK